MIRRTALLLLFACSFCVSQTRAQEAEPDANTKTEALYYDAVKAHILGNEKESETLLQEVIKQKPDEPAPYYDLARMMAAQSKNDKAEEYIKKALALDNKNKYYREEYANILVLKSNYDDAATEFSNLARDEKYNEEYLLKSAILYQRGNQYKKALAQLDELDKKSHGDDDILLQKEQVYLKMNDVEGAAGVIQELIKRNPKEPKWYSLLGDLYENNKKPEKAKEVYAQMKEKFPNDPTLQLSMASDALKRGDTAQYRSYVRKAITNKELDAETQLRLLGPYLQEFSTDSAQRKEAMKLIVQVVDQHPDNVNAILAYGDILSISNQTEPAAAQYKKAVALDPSKFNRWEKLLANYLGRNDADSLIRYSEKAARLFPNQAVVHYYNGVGHYNKKEYSAAAKAYQRAIDLQPEENVRQLAGIYSSLGDTYNALKEYAQSDSALEHALRLDKNDASVLNNYAYYLSERKVRLEDAARMSKRSLELRPDEGTFLDTYGWILYQQGKYEEAKTYIKKAIDAAGNGADATLYEHMAAVEYKLGSVDKAMDAWRTAKAKGSENTNLDKMIADRKLYE